MESYETIMGLVEDVRDILDLHEVEGLTGKQRKAVIAKIKASHDPAKHGPDASKHARKVLKGIKTGHAGSTPHNPFKNIKKGKNLGPTNKTVAKVKGPSTTTPGQKRKRWKCRCSNYHCICSGKNAEGKQTIKHVEIKRGYKKGYNLRYKKWRKKNQGKFASGGQRGFKAPKKPHHMGYHSDD